MSGILLTITIVFYNSELQLVTLGSVLLVVSAVLAMFRRVEPNRQAA